MHGANVPREFVVAPHAGAWIETDANDEFQCRGGFGDLDDATKGSKFVATPKGWKVVKPSKAGGLAVIEIDF